MLMHLVSYRKWTPAKHILEHRCTQEKTSNLWRQRGESQSILETRKQLFYSGQQWLEQKGFAKSISMWPQGHGKHRFLLSVTAASLPSLSGT